LIQIQLAKDALIAFLRDSRFTIAELPHLKVRGDFESANDYKIHIQATQRSFFNYLHLKLITNSNLTSELHLAIELIVHSNIHERHRANALRDVIDKKGLVVLKGAQNCFIGKRHSGFHLTFIKDLVEYIENPISAGYSVPVCEVEQLYFTWLMSCQTVQPSDIFKLTLSDFKFVRRVNGNITHIESDYFKGRANTYHQLNTLKTANDAGKAVLRYISDVTGMENKRTYLVPKLSTAYIVSGHGLIGWSVMLCANTSISTILEKKYLSQKITPVFIEAFGALINKGLTKRKSERRGMNNCETLVTRNFFGLASIKTSAVYAQSDTFDPTTLFNYNSHTDKTERLSYLTPHNEEWQNSCGKITRAVMRDLSVNLFRASQHDREIFNSEYSHAAELIKARSNEVLASMKIVTQKRDGRIDQLGILRNNHIEADLPDTIYLQDSPETVMKLKHYLDEVKSKQSMLKKSSPEFLLFTVLPTTEWIETLFEQKSFTKASLISGEALYVKYRAQLPPLFTAQLA
jgi:hypothetical protein